MIMAIQILGLFNAPELMAVAAAVEKDILAMVDEEWPDPQEDTRSRIFAQPRTFPRPREHNELD
jgi:hypothetical protein